MPHDDRSEQGGTDVGGVAESIEEAGAASAEKVGTGASGDTTLGDERPHATESGAYGDDRGLAERGPLDGERPETDGS